MSDAWGGTGDDPMGSNLFAYHLSSGVAYLCPVPDHDPEGRR